MGSLGLVALPLFPLALPGVVLFLIAPLMLLAGAGLLLATPFLLPIALARIARRSRSRVRSAAAPARHEIGAATGAP